MLRVCNIPGCPELSDKPRCPKHRDPRPSARARGYDRAWERCRNGFIQRFPWCQHPGCHEPATDVDHVDGLGPHGPRGHDWSNMRGYCHAHHSQRTARDQPGGWHA